MRCGYVSNVLLLIQSVCELALCLSSTIMPPHGDHRPANRTPSPLPETLDLLILVQRSIDAAVLYINRMINGGFNRMPPDHCDRTCLVMRAR